MSPAKDGDAKGNDHSGEWTTGLFDCCEDSGSCIMTFCCPCITFGQNAVIVSKNDSSCCGSGTIYTLLAFFGLACLYSYPYRNKLRGRFELPEEPCGDCLLHCFCNPCALCQEYRELKNRGLNPSKGWDDDEAHSSKLDAMSAPVVAKGMPRS